MSDPGPPPPDPAPAAPDRPPRFGMFHLALLICAAVGALGILAPGSLASASASITDAIFGALDWYFMVVVTGFFLLSLWLAFGPYGSVVLGQPGDAPEFSMTSWLAMMFAAGIGSGLLFWGVAEPMTHFADPPVELADTPAKARHAMVITIFHWGMHAWGIYAIAALVLAWFGFRKGTPYLPGAPLRAVFRGRWVAPVAGLADLIAVIAVALGVAGAIAMGTMQFHNGLATVTDVPPDPLWIRMLILGALFACYTISATTSLDKGIRILSNVNMLLAIALLIFALSVGPTGQLLRGFVTALGDYIAAAPALSLDTYPHSGRSGWFHGWTLIYFMWWIAWAPFVGIFIARISRGRTVREFALGVIGAPTLFSALWFAVFGGLGLDAELDGPGGFARLVQENVATACFALFELLPLGPVLTTIAISLLFVFLVTSADSATYVLGMLTSQGSMDPPVRRKLGWGVSLAVLGGALIIAERVDVVRAIAILGAIPFTLVMLLQVVALLRSMRAELGDRKKGGAP